MPAVGGINIQHWMMWFSTLFLFKEIPPLSEALEASKIQSLAQKNDLQKEKKFGLNRIKNRGDFESLLTFEVFGEKTKDLVDLRNMFKFKD